MFGAGWIGRLLRLEIGRRHFYPSCVLLLTRSLAKDERAPPIDVFCCDPLFKLVGFERLSFPGDPSRSNERRMLAANTPVWFAVEGADDDFLLLLSQTKFPPLGLPPCLEWARSIEVMRVMLVFEAPRRGILGLESLLVKRGLLPTRYGLEGNLSLRDGLLATRMGLQGRRSKLVRRSGLEKASIEDASVAIVVLSRVSSSKLQLLLSSSVWEVMLSFSHFAIGVLCRRLDLDGMRGAWSFDWFISMMKRKLVRFIAIRRAKGCNSTLNRQSGLCVSWNCEPIPLSGLSFRGTIRKGPMKNTDSDQNHYWSISLASSK